jgi:protein-tyrosine kinase
MSRIHEALKKAELEYSEIRANSDLPTTDRQHDTLAPAASPENPAHPNSPAAATLNQLNSEDLRDRCTKGQWQLDLRTSVFNPYLDSHGAEEFRTLRSRLYHVRHVQPLQILLVTSAVPGEGKTFVTSNLAQAIVRQNDRHVLIIDADLRCSRLHVPLGAPAGPGLTEYLRGDLDESTIIHRQREGNLFLVPGGAAVTNPSELLSNGRLKVLLDRVSPAFDWIILDSPPCLPVADASVLAETCDGLLLVVKAGYTRSTLVQKASQMLQGRKIVGVVMNSVKERTLDYSRYYEAHQEGAEAERSGISGSHDRLGK